MSRVGSTLLALLQNGTVRASLVLFAFMYLWYYYQLGGLNTYLLNSWLVLALPLAVAAIGVTLVIITKQFDLSAAGVVTLVNVLVGTKFSEVNPWIGLLAMILLGTAIGTLNGFFVVVGRLPAIAVTLATLIILNGLALVLLPQPGGRVPQELIDLVNGPEATVPRPVLLIAVLIVWWLGFRRSKLGIYMFALGQDREALHLSGISVARVQIAIFAIAGAFYGLAGVLISAAVQSADATIAVSYLLGTFAAIAIGGTAFTGGTGTVVGTILGALTLIVIPKVLFVIGISDWVQNIFTGLLIIAAVLVGAISTQSKTKQVTLRKSDADVDAEKSARASKGAPQ